MSDTKESSVINNAPIPTSEAAAPAAPVVKASVATPVASNKEKEKKKKSTTSRGQMSRNEKAVVVAFFAMWCLCVYSCVGGKI